nr:MAG TPA: hypothetical protein [Caudoviricetes sp.]
MVKKLSNYRPPARSRFGDYSGNGVMKYTQSGTYRG